ncbi:MAG TPA: hypothetical protein VLZ78_11025, partial [Terrimesophilobacter sp.]|nr:hypothetical protein [Terrimesophilobacter sp.]
MSINDHEGRLFGVRHSPSLSTTACAFPRASGAPMQTFTSNLTPDAQRMIRSRGLGSLADRMG